LQAFVWKKKSFVRSRKAFASSGKAFGARDQAFDDQKQAFNPPNQTFFRRKTYGGHSTTFITPSFRALRDLWFALLNSYKQ